MSWKKLMTKKFLVGAVLGAMLSVAIVGGCSIGSSPEDGLKSSGESGVEHGSKGEGAEGSGGESGNESAGGGSEEGSGAGMLALDETFDTVRGGARLILNYNAASNAFIGSVENTTNNTLTNVRIEIHLSNGVELGPTTPVDMAPGEALALNLPATPEAFTGWTPHAEVGGGEGSGSGGESGSESGPDGPESSAEAAMEAAMSSPITPLDQTWNGVLGGLAVAARYDAATKSVHATVRNTTSQTLCYVQAEPHLKSGAQTAGELGPGKMGDLDPGQEATSSLSVASEPGLAGVSYDGYVVHMEVFDCGGPGPVAHTGSEGAEGGSGESGSESGSEGSGGSEEGSGAGMLALDETFDTVRGGARLILNYNAASNAFIGSVENTTNNTLTNVRIEIHLSNGVELGPTTPVDMAPGEALALNLPATPEAFTGWTPHAEVGGGEGGSAGGESGPDGPEGPESGSEAAMEAAMSSPIIPLGQTWSGALGGLAISARHDAATKSIHTTARNTTSQTLCYVQTEPHLKSGSQTVGELGPGKMGDLNPGQEATSILAVANEPELAGVSYDGYVIHMEVFDCAGPGPVAHTTSGEGAEGGSGESGSEGGSESGGTGSEEGGGGASMLAPNEVFDMVRGGGRLIMAYDASSNSFKGVVQNTTNGVLSQVRIEVHLSNGAELGPTTPIDMAPGQTLGVILPSTPESFTGWVAHAEVGGGEGSESGGEHGGSGGESGGEHGSGGERRGDG